jgi:hypothetical protein
MVLTVSFVISPVTGLSCHRRCTELLPRNLTPASGRQDHTTSPSASARFVKRTISVHRIPSRVRDDREPPLCGTGSNRFIPVSTKSSSEISENQKSIQAASDPRRLGPYRSIREEFRGGGVIARHLLRAREETVIWARFVRTGCHGPE